MRKTYASIAIGVLLMAATATIAEAQQVKKGTLSGTAFSASAIANASSAPLYTAPASGDGIAIVTGVCGNLVAQTTQPHISGSTLGPLGVSTGAYTCLSLFPGLVLPAGEVLTWTQPFAFDQMVTISGIISKK